MTPAGLGERVVVRGPVDGQVFVPFPRDSLVPTLQPGQIVVLDNLSVPKCAAARELIEAADCSLCFLPP